MKMFVIISMLLGLGSCASNKIAPSESSTELQISQDKLKKTNVRIDQSLLLKQRGPVAVPREKIHGEKATRLWNKDRRNLRVCVATHEQLATEYKVRNNIVE